MINRDSYKSLLESVNEAVSLRNISEEANIKWGDPSIGGARNAMELARWLNSQQGSGTSTGTKSASIGSGKKSKKKSMAEGWGSSAVGGARNAYELARNLNAQQNSVSSAGTASGPGSMGGKKMKRKPSSASTAMEEGWEGAPGGAQNAYELAQYLNTLQGSGGSSPTASKTPSIGASGKKAKRTATVAEEWDIIDSILAEGIELYGEDGLAEILADFAETGEISDELAELL